MAAIPPGAGFPKTCPGTCGIKVLPQSENNDVTCRSYATTNKSVLGLEVGRGALTASTYITMRASPAPQNPDQRVQP